MKTYTHMNRRIWYDPHLRMWTLQDIDSEENQVGEVTYASRAFAFTYLYAKPSKGPRNP
jgi:hypothetical protein